jgi:transcriptional regulator with XRE-family HTH domain
MARPRRKPFLNPRRPTAGLGYEMQKQRLAHGWSGKQVAERYGTSPSRISRVEQGEIVPSLMLVLFYDDTFGCDGLLLSLYQVVSHEQEQERRRWGGQTPRLYTSQPGDASTFLGDTIPHGTLMSPGQLFEKRWRIENSGTIPWQGRRLERQGPHTGPGLISSLRFYDVPDTQPGETIEITAPLKAPTYDCASIAYFKLVDSQGRLYFPDNYQLGLDILVLVRGQRPDNPSVIDPTPGL